MQHNDTSWTTAFSSRADGDLRNTDARDAFLSTTLGVGEDDLVTVQQVHGTTVAVVSANDRGSNIPNADALVYKADGAHSVALGVRAADCTPLLFVDEKAGVMGAAHAGWRGTLGGIAARTVEAMVRQGADPARIRVVIGPHIQSCCYAVLPDRIAAFQQAFPRATDLVVERDGKAYLSLQAALISQLTQAGIAPQAIVTTTVCTASHPDRYFSFRADGPTLAGEQMGFIAYKGART